MAGKFLDLVSIPLRYAIIMKMNLPISLISLGYIIYCRDPKMPPPPPQPPQEEASGDSTGTAAADAAVEAQKGEPVEKDSAGQQGVGGAQVELHQLQNQ